MLLSYYIGTLLSCVITKRENNLECDFFENVHICMTFTIVKTDVSIINNIQLSLIYKFTLTIGIETEESTAFGATCGC